jgi:hypothetical protein
MNTYNVKYNVFNEDTNKWERCSSNIIASTAYDAEQHVRDSFDVVNIVKTTPLNRQGVEDDVDKNTNTALGVTSLGDIFINMIVSKDNEYNGHCQLEIGEICLDTLLEITASLEEYCNKNNLSKGMCHAKVFSDKSGVVEMSDWWEQGEHPLGHTERTMFGFKLRGS